MAKNITLLLLPCLIAFCTVSAQDMGSEDETDDGSDLSASEHASHANDLYWNGQLPTATSIRLNLPPRYMWGWGPGLHGYCGSTSTQTAGLYFGNWISLEFIRYAAGNVEVLIERDHIDLVADVFKMRMTVFDNDWREKTTDGALDSENPRFFSWMYRNLHQGHVTVGGWYEWNTRALVDNDYDHIVPMPGMTWTGTGSMTQTFIPTASNSDFNVTSIWYNNLWSNATIHRLPPLVVNRSDYISSTPAQQPYRFKLPDNVNYGFAVEGIFTDGGCGDNSRIYRMMLHASNWTEPDWGGEDKRDQGHDMIWFAATIFGLEANARYAVLRFDGNMSIPTNNFLDHAYASRVDFTATGLVHFIPKMETVRTDNVYSYRTVRISGPPLAAQKDDYSKAIVLSSLVVGGAGIICFIVSACLFCKCRGGVRRQPDDYLIAEPNGKF